MNQNRKTFAWVALIGSLVACLPCACLSGFFTVLGTGALTIPDFSENSTAEDTFFTVLFALITLVALILGLISLVWGVRTLRQISADESKLPR
jgi:hypothetical protein